MQPDAARRAEISDWLIKVLRPMFEHRTLPISEDVIFKWRLLVTKGKKAGHTFRATGPFPRCNRSLSRADAGDPQHQGLQLNQGRTAQPLG